MNCSGGSAASVEFLSAARTGEPDFMTARRLADTDYRTASGAAVVFMSFAVAPPVTDKTELSRDGAFYLFVCFKFLAATVNIS